MDVFQPVPIVENFLRREFSQQKKIIMEMPRNVYEDCEDNDNCVCANLCHVVKSLNAEHFTNHLINTPYEDCLRGVANHLGNIVIKMREKIHQGKELLFVKNFTEDENIPFATI